MDHIKFDVEDFLSDISFQQHCLGNDVKAVHFWKEWIMAHPEKKAQFEAARKLYFNLNGNITNENFNDDFEFFKTAFFKHIHPNPVISDFSTQSLKRNRTVRSLWMYTAGVAASIIIAIVLFLNQRYQAPRTKVHLLSTYVTPEGQKRTIFLSDHTRVMMNGGSTLIVEKGYNTKSRNVQLRGEAFFEVSHNVHLPFIVHTSRFDVKVLGTVFNVKAYAADKLSETTLLKGSVKVTLKDAFQSEILLVPHKKIVISNITYSPLSQHQVQKEVLDYTIINTDGNKSRRIIRETAWTQNRLIFNNESLDNISATLGRWYGIKISIGNPNYSKFRYTAAFENDDIIHILNTLQLTNHFNYRKEAGRIIIY